MGYLSGGPLFRTRTVGIAEVVRGAPLAGVRRNEFVDNRRHGIPIDDRFNPASLRRIAMAEPTSNTSDVIVVGCGVAGASTAMQLAQRGLRVTVIDRGMLGSGSTGRAAGLLGQLRSTRAATKMLIDGLEIVRDLQRET